LICIPGNAGVVILRAAHPSEADAVQAIWESSFNADDPGGWARGGWSVAAWATHTSVLVLDGRLVGVAAVRAEIAPDGAMPGRVALHVAVRQPALAERLVHGVLGVVRETRAERARLFVPSEAAWTQDAARQAGFVPVRTIAHMMLAADAPTPDAAPPPDVRLRAIRPDEDAAVLAALNVAWTGTWNFVPITLNMLQQDLNGQREGMLLAVDAADRIVATCHAVFDPSERNPDGNPRAWISNLTVAPAYRGQGISRAMLAAGIAHLRSRGATSVTLGVDADNPAPFRLYLSVGFQIASKLEAWDSEPLGEDVATAR
jgi:mycothiol synthase